MNLYCALHRCSHSMTDGQVEVLVYALQAELAEERCESDTEGRDELTELDSECPLRTYREARDAELYGEHIDSMIERRRQGGHH